MGTSHIVWKHRLSAGKPFFPGGYKLELRYFQEALRRQQGKIRVSEGLIQKYGLSSKVKLGRGLLSAERHFATYLYDNVIHPRFFAETLHVIASHAKAIEPRLDHIQLRNLRRDKLATAIGDKIISENDLGTRFELFSQRPAQERLIMLEKLGVLVFKKEKNNASVKLEPRPPIKNIDPGKKKPSKKTQLDFFKKQILKKS